MADTRSTHAGSGPVGGDAAFEGATFGGSSFEEGESLPDPLPDEPFTLFAAWLGEAVEAGRQPNPNAFTLATIAEPVDGGPPAPDARVVLCKGVSTAEGRITFYTNYDGRKGRELSANPRACAVFHWDHADRQVRIEGRVVRSPGEESDAYFATRAWQSRIGARVSRQSEPLPSRSHLLEAVGEEIARLGLDLGELMSATEDGRQPDVTIPRPPNWGGFRLWATSVELWCAGIGRIHDRARWTRRLEWSEADRPASTAWSAVRLQP